MESSAWKEFIERRIIFYFLIVTQTTIHRTKLTEPDDTCSFPKRMALITTVIGCIQFGTGEITPIGWCKTGLPTERLTNMWSDECTRALSNRSHLVVGWKIRVAIARFLIEQEKMFSLTNYGLIYVVKFQTYFFLTANHGFCQVVAVGSP